ncbi:MAG: lipopolysaccharide biosynthesis protein [Kiritimatiellae bacterium]|nr:lipopolysaccharide biosynthesis protein [Kiritimatiellia bacterium]
MADSLKNKVAKGAVWATMEKFSVEAMHFVVGMVLARLLTPTDYGTVALLSIFFAVAGSLASCGFGNALVQRKDAGDLEFNSVFYMSIAAALVIYVIMFFAAPYIADFYNVPVLCPLARVSAIGFILNAINSVQGAELSRKMLFDRRFKITLIVSVVSAVSGITLAYFGFGVWALVFTSLLSNVASVIAYWTIIAWRPRPMFSFKKVKGLFSYGWKLSLASMIDSLYNNIYGLLIGRVYTPADLAFVNKSRAMPSLLMSTVNGTINSVSFPALAQLQSDKMKFRDGMRRMIQCSTFLVFPLLTVLAMTARPLILLLYGSRWEPAVIYVPIGCFVMAVSPICGINCLAISAFGRSGILLILEIVKKGTGLALMLLSIRHGVMPFVLTMAFVQGPVGLLANTFANGRLIGYTFGMQMRDIAPSVGLCSVSAAGMWGVGLALTPLCGILPSQNIAYAIMVVVQGCSGFGLYFALAYAFRLRPLAEYCNIMLPILQKRLPKLAERIAGINWWRAVVV